MGENARTPTILVVDDDPEILSLLTIRLTKAGYAVIQANDGEQALIKVREHLPKVVLLDVMMPGKNGWEVAKEIRQDDALRHVGIMILTAIGENINEMTSPLYGVDDYLDKPFEFADLEARLKVVLAKRP